MGRTRTGVTTPESRVRFLITTADGTRYVGPVQGSGGEIGGPNALHRLLVAQKQAAEGQPLRIAERKPGHVIVHVGACALSDGISVDVPLVGSTIVKVSARDSRTLVQMLHSTAKRYAQKYVNDDGDPECTDDDITRVLAGCAIRPHAELYPSIRTAVYDLVTEGGRRKP